jgi:beta-phosphoglucomutase-like phosphatase (HAD superfamily)
MQALSRLSLSGAATLAADDTVHEVAAAHSAGMRCTAFPTRSWRCLLFAQVNRFARRCLLVSL